MSDTNNDIPNTLFSDFKYKFMRYVLCLLKWKLMTCFESDIIRCEVVYIYYYYSLLIITCIYNAST